jgi:hypothetical protein
MLGKQFNWHPDNRFRNRPPVWFIEGERWRLGRPNGKWSQKYARHIAEPIKHGFELIDGTIIEMPQKDAA